MSLLFMFPWLLLSLKIKVLSNIRYLVIFSLHKNFTFDKGRCKLCRWCCIEVPCTIGDCLPSLRSWDSCGCLAQGGSRGFLTQWVLKIPEGSAHKATGTNFTIFPERQPRVLLRGASNSYHSLASFLLFVPVLFIFFWFLTSNAKGNQPTEDAPSWFSKIISSFIFCFFSIIFVFVVLWR